MYYLYNYKKQPHKFKSIVMKQRKSLLICILTILFISFSYISSAQEKVKEEPKLPNSVGWAVPTPKTIDETIVVGTPFASTGIWNLSEGKSTRLILKKYFQEESVSKESEFEMEEDQRRFKVSISGWCKSGMIHVTILRPSEKVYKTLTIDSSAEVEWSQSVRFTEEDEDYVGKWIIQIVAKDADGSYNFVLSAD